MTTLVALKGELMARAGRGARLGLDRMEHALAVLGRPDRRLAVVHVGGTNGKGSTCAFIEAMARAAGLRTGLYSSPHLCRLNERIRVDGQPVDDEALAAALERALGIDREPSFFEVMTLAAFVAFAEAHVDLAIIEVGLGGRLDATNVVERPLVTAITSIALDHCAILGNTIGDIAGEKAGIIKSSVPLVLGPMPDEARGPIVARAAEMSAHVIEATDFRGDGLALAGAHQRANAAVAAAVASLLPARLGIDRPAIDAGLATASWPGRLERIARGGITVLLDCAHNPHAAAALATAAADVPRDRMSLVFGTMEDKAWTEMLALLGPRAHARYYCEPLPELAGRRPTAPAALAAAIAGVTLTTPIEAIDRALSDAQPGDTILVTGSIFLVGAVRGHLLGIEPDVMVAL